MSVWVCVCVCVCVCARARARVCVCGGRVAVTAPTEAASVAVLRTKLGSDGTRFTMNFETGAKIDTA